MFCSPISENRHILEQIKPTVETIGKILFLLPMWDDSGAFYCVCCHMTSSVQIYQDFFDQFVFPPTSLSLEPSQGQT